MMNAHLAIMVLCKTECRCIFIYPHFLIKGIIGIRILNLKKRLSSGKLEALFSSGMIRWLIRVAKEAGNHKKLCELMPSQARECQFRNREEVYERPILVILYLFSGWHCSMSGKAAN